MKKTIWLLIGAMALATAAVASDDGSVADMKLEIRSARDLVERPAPKPDIKLFLTFCRRLSG